MKHILLNKNVQALMTYCSSVQQETLRDGTQLVSLKFSAGRGSVRFLKDANGFQPIETSGNGVNMYFFNKFKSQAAIIRAVKAFTERYAN